ncbi:MAG: hypothetical protein ACLUD0_18200 [Eubacterium ramulus]
MYKIGILFLDREFEHDVYELDPGVLSGSEITMLSMEEEPERSCTIFISDRRSRTDLLYDHDRRQET